MATEAPTLGQLESESAQDTMRAVLAETGTTPAAAADEVLNGGAVEPPVIEEKPVAETPKDTAAEERERDEKGRFLAKEKADAEATVSAEPLVTEAAPPITDEDPLEPLPDWSADKHEAFRKLPRADQQFVLDTVKAAQDKAAEAANAGGKYAELEAILGPRREALARDGLTEAGYLRQLTALSDFAGKDAQGFVRWFMQQRGMDPNELFPQQDQEYDAENVDPVYQRLMQANNQLQAKLDSIEQKITNQESTHQAQSQQRIVSEIEGFGKAVDDKGRLQHPYFEQLRLNMGALMQAEKRKGRDIGLKDAYDMACRADPDVNAKIASAQKAQEERDRAKQQRVKAEAASRAGSSVSGTPGDRAPPEPTGDIREDMRRQFVEQGIPLS